MFPLFALAPMAGAESLEDGFRNPPNAARPQTWWHWMNGNISREGIRLDLQAMKAIGLGGATIINVDCGIPAGKVEVMSPEWRDDIAFAIREADRLGLKIGLSNTAGYSNSGGPWIAPDQAMKRLTAAETSVAGGRLFDAILPLPPTTLGYYRDVAVLAYRKPGTGDSPMPDDDGAFVAPMPPKGSRSVPFDEIVDLSGRFAQGGRLKWTVPAGEWTILRVGYTLTGAKNFPSPKGGEGLECDKFSKAALDVHWNGLVQKILDGVGPLVGRTLDTSLIDSYEVGGQDWTADFRAQFTKRRGYDPLKYLVSFSGQVVQSPEITKRFLWDMRRTIADLFAENYYDHFAELCRAHGMKSAVEPYVGPFESMQAGAKADSILGEFWSGTGRGGDWVKMAASIAHVNGQRMVSAESFSAEPVGGNGKWQEEPYGMKPLGDRMFCLGVNRYTFHRYAHQPWTDRVPGMTMGPWGFHFERTNTWWKQGKPWIDYVTRCQYLLQRGRSVQDIACFTGESAPVTLRNPSVPVPPGYDWDAINPDALFKGATVKKGRINLPSGASYAALVLPTDDRDMSPRMMETLRDLVRQGATLVGPPPERSPGLAEYPTADGRVRKLARELWGDCDGDKVQEHAYGAGRVVWGKSLERVFRERGLRKDFAFTSQKPSDILYTHRVDGDSDIYFVSNQRREFTSVDCTFRVEGKVPELWHPDTQTIESAPIWTAANGQTKVRLDLDPAGSVFVVFRRPTSSIVRFADVKSTVEPPIERERTLTIKKATYVSIDGSGKPLDATERVARLAEKGRLTIHAESDILGGDPAPRHVKELRIDYTLDGVLKSLTVAEHDTQTLPAKTIGSAPSWQAIVKDGQPFVKLWGRGAIELDSEHGISRVAETTDLPRPVEIVGAWTLRFPPNLGAPPSVNLNPLISWTDHPIPGVRYFSGTATYGKEISIAPEQLAANRELWLDLGEVKNFAEVILNGKNLGILWKAPFRVDLTPAAKPGINRLEIKVTNLWPNRLIGDEQLPSDVEWVGDDSRHAWMSEWLLNSLKGWPQWLLDGKPSPIGRVTFTTWHHFRKDDPLLESGLLGPVFLRSAEIVRAKSSLGSPLIPTSSQ